MKNSSSYSQSGITAMRWVARIVSIPWAYCALGLVWFVAGYGIEEGRLSELTAGIIIFTAFLLTLGASILAAVWGKEVFGGWALLADALLIFVWFVVTPQLPGVAFLILLFPPLLAGSLFLVCHRSARTPGNKQS